MINGENTTDALDTILRSSGADQLNSVIDIYSDTFSNSKRPFTDYIRNLFRLKGIKQKDLFIAADIDEKFGYKIISGEKHTSNRNIILRICIAADFNVDETNRALKFYGMSPLYPRIIRDAIIINSIANEKKDIWEINTLLTGMGEHGLDLE